MHNIERMDALPLVLCQWLVLGQCIGSMALVYIAMDQVTSRELTDRVWSINAMTEESSIDRFWQLLLLNGRAAAGLWLVWRRGANRLGDRAFLAYFDDWV